MENRKRYVDDILDVMKMGQMKRLTDHLNFIEKTGSKIMQFTVEEEVQGSIPFLNLLITRQVQWNLKLPVYRKQTHKDQYLNFQSHHPTQHKESTVSL